MPEFLRHETSQHHRHWANWVICGQLNRQTCRSVFNTPLLVLYEEVLVVETNNTHYEETVDPVTDDIAIEELSDWSVELSLNLVRMKRNNWSARTLLHTLLQTAHLKQMWWSLTVHLLLKLPRTLNTFQDYSNSVFLPCIFGQLQCSAVGYRLGRLSRRQLEGRDKKQTGPWSTS